MAKQRRVKRQGGPRKPAVEETSSGGGFLTSMRSGIKSAAGTGPVKKQTLGQQIWGALLWILLAAVVIGFVWSRSR